MRPDFVADAAVSSAMSPLKHGYTIERQKKRIAAAAASERVLADTGRVLQNEIHSSAAQQKGLIAHRDIAKSRCYSCR